MLIHHPPKSSPGRRFRRLVDARDFRAVLAEHGADLVLHGHNHVHSLIWLDGPKAAHSGFRRAVGIIAAARPARCGGLQYL